MNSIENILEAVCNVQEGDYQSIRAAIIGGFVTATACDPDGCSLLHWAAINNRIQIADFLIKHGADAIPGGILQETPLFWAIRKKYYAMAQLLHERLHLNLSHKSKQGLDALFLAVRLGNLLFLIFYHKFL
jgi:palmitoyltransferase ZDHHC13/17